MGQSADPGQFRTKADENVGTRHDMRNAIDMIRACRRSKIVKADDSQALLFLGSKRSVNLESLPKEAMTRSAFLYPNLKVATSLLG